MLQVARVQAACGRPNKNSRGSSASKKEYLTQTLFPIHDSLYIEAQGLYSVSPRPTPANEWVVPEQSTREPAVLGPERFSLNYYGHVPGPLFVVFFFGLVMDFC